MRSKSLSWYLGSLFFLLTFCFHSLSWANVQITDLFAIPLTNEPTILLYWTPPKDFNVKGYWVGYSKVPITTDNWETIPKIKVEGPVGDLGIRYAKVSNLDFSTKYYLAIQAYDDKGNTTALSNIVSAKTTDSAKEWHFSSIEEMTDNSWFNLNPALPPGSTSQVFLAYDPEKDMLMTWGGHPAGGGYPQVDEIYIYNISNLRNKNTWEIEKIADDSDKPISGCSTDGAVYDINNRVLIKVTQHYTDRYEYYRKRDLEPHNKTIWVYDFDKHKWYNMRPFDYNQLENAGAAGSYDTKRGYYLGVDPRKSRPDRTILYDPYTNKIQKIYVNDWNGSGSRWNLFGGNRIDPAIVYDSKRDVFYLVGGLYYNKAKAYYDIWQFDPKQKKWFPIDGVDNTALVQTIPEHFHISASTAVYDSIHDKVILFQAVSPRSGDINYPEGRYVFTFVYDPSTKKWKRLNDKPGYFKGKRWMDLNAIFSEKHNIAILLDESQQGPKGVGSQTWAFRYSSTDNTSQILPPRNLNITTTASEVILNWKESLSRPDLYRIYRAKANYPWDITDFEKIREVPSSETTYTDNDVIPGNIYFYYVTAVRDNKESSHSNIVRSQPEVVREGYVVVKSSNEVEIKWNYSASDIIGFNIYRAECNFEIYPINEPINKEGELSIYNRPVIHSVNCPGEEEYIKINSSPVSGTHYIDHINLINANSNYPFKVYAYRIKVINKFGVESGWSPYWLTIPEPPTGLKISQDESNFYLSWKSPHDGKGIKGYRVYMAYDHHHIKEVTTDPVTEPHIVIPKSVDTSDKWQRFFITAVDNLGQEGIPSGGEWGERMYWYFYKQYFEFSITSSFLPDAQKNNPYKFQLEAVNGEPPYTWSLISGELPLGLELQENGLIIGTPQEEGEFHLKIQVQDSDGIIKVINLTLRVNKNSNTTDSNSNLNDNNDNNDNNNNDDNDINNLSDIINSNNNTKDISQNIDNDIINTSNDETTNNSNNRTEPDISGDIINVNIHKIEDTTLSVWHPNKNFGAENKIVVAENAKKIGLIKFDLSQIPEGSTVKKAELRLYCYKIGYPKNPYIEVYALGHEWVEGNSYSYQSPTGATWNEYDYQDGQNTWDVLSEIDTSDFGYGYNGLIAKVNVEKESWVSIDITNVVQKWIDGEIENHGLLIKSNTPYANEMYFYSSEYNDPNRRPYVHIELEE